MLLPSNRIVAMNTAGSAPVGDTRPDVDRAREGPTRSARPAATTGNDEIRDGGLALAGDHRGSSGIAFGGHREGRAVQRVALRAETREVERSADRPRVVPRSLGAPTTVFSRWRAVVVAGSKADCFAPVASSSVKRWVSVRPRAVSGEQTNDCDADSKAQRVGTIVGVMTPAAAEPLGGQVRVRGVRRR